MLALKQALSLVSTPKLGGWSPDDESSLVAWYQNAVGITLNGSNVSHWEDSAPDGSYDMEQGTSAEQPAYSGGVLTFVSANDENLQTAGQISLAEDFTVGIKINPAIAIAGTFLGDITLSGELFKYASATRIAVKIDGSSSTSLDLDSGTFGDDYLVITRLSDEITLWKNGVAQTGTTPTLAGTADIDAISGRTVGGGVSDYFDGTIEEIQIYSISSDNLTSNINDRLSTL